MRIKVFYKETGKDALSDIRHTHDNELELIQILSGSGKLFVNDRVLPFAQGAVFLIDGAALHYICPDADTRYVRNKLILSKEISLVEALPSDFSGFLWRTLSREDMETVCDKFEAIAELASCCKEPLLQLSEAFALLHMCCEIKTREDSRYHGTVADVVSHIHDRLTQELSLDRVAQALHINKYYLCRLFKRETGMTVGRYINSARIALAKRLLRESDGTVTFIASKCGFNELSVFTKSFKKEVGMTPTEYRFSS